MCAMCTFQPCKPCPCVQILTEPKYVRPTQPEISLCESLTADILAAIKSSYEIGSVLSEGGWSTVHSVLDRCDPLLPVTYCSQESDTVCPLHIYPPLSTVSPSWILLEQYHIVYQEEIQIISERNKQISTLHISKHDSHP